MKTTYMACITIIVCLALPLARAHSQIEEACKKYNTTSSNGTQTCVSILGSIPGCRGPSDNPTMFALASMEFAERKVSEVANIISARLRADRSLNPKVYRSLSDCVHLYNEGSYSFGFGLLAFKEKNYETVNYRWLNGASYDVVQCERKLNMVGVKGVDLGIQTEYILEVCNSAKAAFYYFVDKLHITHVVT